MEDLPGIAERIVQRGVKAGAQVVVAGVDVDRSYQIRFAQNQPVISNRWAETTAEVGLVVDQRVVATQIADLSAVEPAVDELVQLARKSQKNPLFAGIAQGPFQYADQPPDPKLLALEEGGEFVEAGVNAALEAGAVEAAGSFWRHDHEVFLHTSNDVTGHDRQASIYLSLRALAGPESSGHGVSCASRLADFDPERAGRRAGEIAALAKRPKAGKAGKYDVIFDPLILGALASEVGARASAFSVLAGLSPFKDKVGEAVASTQVTLVEDGGAESISRRRFDEEGVPTQRTALIEKGTLQTYLHNTSTAKQFGTETTGNAGFVAPAPHALFLEPGEYGREELFQEVKDGLWLTNTWYTRFQSYVSGDFSTIPRDGIFRIQDGEVVEAWKDIRLTDNLLHLWQSMDALGKEVEQVEWWYEIPFAVWVPYAVSRDIGITTSSM